MRITKGLKLKSLIITCTIALLVMIFGALLTIGRSGDYERANAQVMPASSVQSDESPLVGETGVIYASGTSGSDTNDGATSSTPVATMQRVLELLPNGGTVNVLSPIIIDSSIGKKAKVTISSTRLFHILGLEEKVIKANMQEFESVFNHSDNIKSLMTDRKDLFTVLEKILANETRIINAVLEGKLNHTFNFPKIEMKNYAFERMGMLEHSSGVIFYDKTIDTSLEAKTSHLKSDLFLLNDFIRNYDLDFVFSAYRPYKFSRNFSMINKKTNIQNNLPTSDAESLFISSKGWENSRFLNGQLSSISESVGIYHKNNFDYTIFLEDESELPPVDPDEYIEFSDEDKARMANVIIENLPNLDNSHLKNLYDELTKGNKKR